MNKTKKSLIMAAAILELIAAFFLLIAFIYFLVAEGAVNQLISEMVGESMPDQINMIRGAFIGVMAFEVLFYLVAPITLLCSIRKGGTKFAQSKGLWITGVVFTIICSPISIPAILIYVALAKKND